MWGGGAGETAAEEGCEDGISVRVRGPGEGDAEEGCEDGTSVREGREGERGGGRDGGGSGAGWAAGMGWGEGVGVALMADMVPAPLPPPPLSLSLPGSDSELELALSGWNFSSRPLTNIFGGGPDICDFTLRGVFRFAATAVRGFHLFAMDRFRFLVATTGGGRGFALPSPIIKNPPATLMLSNMSSSWPPSAGSSSQSRAFWISRSSFSCRRFRRLLFGLLPSERKRFLALRFFRGGAAAAGVRVLVLVLGPAVVVVVVVVSSSSSASASASLASSSSSESPESMMSNTAPPKVRGRRRRCAGGDGVREMGGSRW